MSADEFSDDAHLDVDQLIIRSLRQLEAGHIRILASRVPPSDVEERALREEFPNLALALPALAATLQSEGCLRRSDVDALAQGALTLESYVPHDGPTVQITTYGERVLEFIRAAGAYAADLGSDQPAARHGSGSIA